MDASPSLPTLVPNKSVSVPSSLCWFVAVVAQVMYISSLSIIPAGGNKLVGLSDAASISITLLGEGLDNSSVTTMN